MAAASSVQFMSEKVNLRNKFTTRERFKQFFTGARKLDCIVENPSESFGYVGLTQNQGRIVVIDQSARFLATKLAEIERKHQGKLLKQQQTLIKNILGGTESVDSDESNQSSGDEAVSEREKSFFVREEYVLAHTNNVDLVISQNFDGSKWLKGFKFCKMITKRQMPDIFGDILYQRDLVRPLAPKLAQDKEAVSAELLFIHAQEDLVEKQLGADEAICVAKGCLVAFEDTISFAEVDGAVVLVDAKNQVKIKGPGIAYIETTREGTHHLMETF